MSRGDRFVIFSLSLLVAVLGWACTKRTERITTAGREPHALTPTASSDRPDGHASTLCPNDAVGAVTVISPTHCAVPREVFFGHAGCLSATSKPEPFIGDAGIVGMRLTGVRDTSVYGLCGAQNGDVWLSANGMPLTSPDQALEAYAQLRKAASLRMELQRSGRRIVLDIDFTSAGGP
jgi:hypothetical protein